MKKNFGNIHYTVLFLEKVLSKTLKAEKVIPTFLLASKILKYFDDLQNKNPLVTLSISTDSLRVYFNGHLKFHIQARTGRVIIWIPYAYSQDLSKKIQNLQDLFPSILETISWEITNDGFEWLKNFIEENWSPVISKIESKEDFKHSRYIPGEVRQAVLTDFLNSNKWCAGVSGITKRHKVSDEMQIEFDHILPHTHGGSNSYWNIQILCENCNRIKRATAY